MKNRIIDKISLKSLIWGIMVRKIILRIFLFFEILNKLRYRLFSVYIYIYIIYILYIYIYIYIY